MPESLAAFHTIFTGILLQALPFLLLGALLSSALRCLCLIVCLLSCFLKNMA